ncbi:Ig-like domain-containing protein [Leifsonia aquatica]|uniref:Ig-like domain-containing protein n=1 Tax=Leifsonia aquatica TaxID=144185 RepID=UPI00384D406F
MRISPKPLHLRARRGARLLAGGLGVLATTAALALAAPSAALADQAITSAGPLVKVRITTDLNCAVNYAGDQHSEFFGDTACGTFVAFDDGGVRLLAGPAAVPAGPAVVNAGIPYVPVSQSSAGSGTRADPHSITTTVRAVNDAGVAVLELTQVDSYVVGDNFYATSTSVRSLDAQDRDITLYHGADCYLGEMDSGYGDYSSATGAVTCKASPDSSSRIEQFIPRTPGSDFFYGKYSRMWANIASKAPLPNTLEGAEESQDNAIALSWNLQVPAEGAATASMLTNFSPVDLRALPTTITPDPSSVAAGSTVSLRAEVSNAANTADVSMDALAVRLPRGAAYVDGSLAGASGPASQTGGTLTIPLVQEIAGQASAAVTFDVVLSEQGAAAFELSGSALLAPVLDSSTTVTVTAPLVDAAATDDTASTPYATAVTIPVLANDRGDEIAVSAVGASPDGTATANADGTVTFVPNAGFAGDASFVYTITDERGNRSQATVVVTVEAPAAPVAADDDARTGAGTSVVIPVLDNDSGEAIVVAEAETPEDGTVTLNDDGTVTFAPNDGFAGTATFGYTIEDAVGQRDTATVRVVVDPAPATPPATAPAATEPGGLAVTGSTLPIGLGAAAAMCLVAGLTLLIVRRRRTDPA